MKTWILKRLSPEVYFVKATDQMDEQSMAFYADQIIKNPLYEFIMTELRKQYVQFWSNSSHPEKEKREEYYQYLRALNQVDATFKSCVSAVVNKNMMQDQQDE